MMENTLEYWQGRIAEAMMDDCESGVKWLNEKAAENYLQDYRYLKLVLQEFMAQEFN